jgi:hypothetical protein
MKRFILLAIIALGLFTLVPGSARADGIIIQFPDVPGYYGPGYYGNGYYGQPGYYQGWRAERWRQYQWRKHHAWREYQWHRHYYDDED